MVDDAARTQWWLLAALALLLGATFPYFEGLMNANERPRLLQGIALVEDGTFAIDGPSVAGVDPGIDVSRAPPEAGGRLYPNKPPGTTVVTATAWLALDIVHTVGGPVPTLRSYTWLARMLGAWLPTVVLIWFAWRKVSVEVGCAPTSTAVVLYALCTPACAYARVLFGHQLAACCLLIGTWTIVDAVEGVVERPVLAAVFGGGVAAAAVVVEYTAAFAGLPIAVWIAWCAFGDASPRHGRRRNRVLVAVVVAALVPIAALMAYHAVAFGSVWSTPYHHVVRPEFAAVHGGGLLGLDVPTARSLFEHLLSPWGGLLYWAPMLVVAIAAWAWAERAGEADTRMRLSMAVVLVLLAINLGLGQTGGWRVGPRYLVLAFPMAIPAWSWAARRVGTHRLIFAAFLALVGWSAAINLLAANLFPHLIPVGNPLADLLLPLWADGLEPYNVLRAAFGLERGALWVVAAGTAIVIVTVVRSVHDPRAGGVGPWLVGLFGAVLLVVSALRFPSAPDAEANLDAVERIWEPRAGRPTPPSQELGFTSAPSGAGPRRR